MKKTTLLISWIVLCCVTFGVDVTGELKTWHKVSLTFDGPQCSEGGTPNPFTDYLLDVTFSAPDSGGSYTVPGYFAADGYAAHTSADAGNKWRVHLNPDRVGEWTWTASFTDAKGQAVAPIHEQEGTFRISETDKTGRDFRAHGRLVPERHHLRHIHSGELFLKAGADAPENLLAYEDFDGVFKSDGVKDNLIKTWEPHLRDWNIGDPTWKAASGQGLIGAINYLASRGMNVISFLPLNIEGDDRNVYPYVDDKTFDRFDVSKLEQWEIVFEHAQTKGVFLHFKTQEAENQTLLDDGALGPHRKLYYRELVARFGHHNALNWNLGEENGVWGKNPEQASQSTAERVAMVKWFTDNDPYRHHVVIHNGQSFKDLLGPEVGMSGVSLQTHKKDFSSVYPSVLRWRSTSEKSGHPWAVATDEPGDAQHSLLPDAEDARHDDARKNALWGTFMAGGWGVEWYFGYKHDHSDLTCQDWRSRESMWDQSRHALNFFKKHNLPLENMHPMNELIDENHWVLAGKNAEGRWEIVVYMREGSTATIDLPNSRWTHGWYDPRTGRGAPALLGADRTYGAHELQRKAPDSRDWVLLICEADPSGLDLVPRKKKKTADYPKQLAVFPPHARPPLPIPEPKSEIIPETVAAEPAPEPVARPTVRMADLPIAKTEPLPDDVEFEWVEERVLVKPARSEWKIGRGEVEKVDNGTGSIMCLVELPAEYKTVRKRVMIPGTGTFRRTESTVRTIPAPTRAYTPPIERMAPTRPTKTVRPIAKTLPMAKTYPVEPGTVRTIPVPFKPANTTRPTAPTRPTEASPILLPAAPLGPAPSRTGATKSVAPGAIEVREPFTEVSQTVRMSALRSFPLMNIEGYVRATSDSARNALMVDSATFPGQVGAATGVFTGENGMYRGTLVTLSERGGESAYTVESGRRLLGTFRNPKADTDFRENRFVIPKMALRKGDPITITFDSATNEEVRDGKAQYSNGRWLRLELDRTGPLADDSSIPLRINPLR